VEALNRFETSFINLAEQAVELVRMIDSPAIRIMIDTFHANIEEKSIGKAIEYAGPYIMHIHANENDRGIPGSGHVPWNEVAAALKKVHYDGAMVIESFTTEVKEIARAAAIWRPPAPNQDMLATDGMAFLRKLMQ
jgi:D-psicose/D-tagatose/L-ribulose 3-epimerase